MEKKLEPPVSTPHDIDMGQPIAFKLWSLAAAQHQKASDAEAIYSLLLQSSHC